MCQPCSSRPRFPRGFSRLWSGPATKPSNEIDMWQVVSGTANLLSDCASQAVVPTITSDRWVAPRPQPKGPPRMTTFRTVLEPTGGNNVGIVVPEDIVLSFDRGQRVPVVVTIDGDYRYKTTIGVMGGSGSGAEPTGPQLSPAQD